MRRQLEVRTHSGSVRKATRTLEADPEVRRMWREEVGRDGILYPMDHYSPRHASELVSRERLITRLLPGV